MQPATKQKAADAVLRHKLPKSFLVDAESYLLPLAEQISEARRKGSPLITGIQGSQGSGKSTSAEFLKLFLEYEFDLRVAICSIDDFYLSQLERQELAAKIHPLFKTRGVPGTHHVKNISQQFHKFRTGQTLTIPQFDKAQDNPKPSSEWIIIEDKLDVLIFEGWCVGIPPQAEPKLKLAVNSLESDEDENGTWRQFVNEQLKSDYAYLFNQLDLLIVLQAPSFASVYEWRQLQEQKLVEKLNKEGKSTDMTLSTDQLKRFIQHYQRLTEHALTVMAEEANFVLDLDINHRFTAFRQR